MKNIARGFTVVFVPGIILLVLIFVLATNDDSSGEKSGATTAEPATSEPAPATSTGAGEPATNEPGEIVKAPAFSADELAAPATADWITNGGSLANNRYSTLDEIYDQNIKDLKGKWMTALKGSGTATKYSAEGQPIVYKGTIYQATGADDVFAVDVKTGKILWQYEAKLDQKIDTVCCGWLSRGVALGDGMVFIGQLDGQMVALDQTTGKVVWKSEVDRLEDGQRHHRGAPVLRRHDLHRHHGRRVRRPRAADGAGREDRQGGVALLHDPRARRHRQRDLAGDGRRLGARRRTRVADAVGRPEARDDLLHDRQRLARRERLEARR